MANRKEYEMLFRLNAQLGGSYNSAFKAAQNAVLSMQKEIEALSKTQADISAFQKQQNAVEATRNKLAVLQQQYDNIQREIKETGEFSSDLQNKLLSNQQQIDRTSASLEQQTQKLQQMDTALRDAGVDTGNLTGESSKLSAQIGELKTRQEEAANGAQSFGDTSAEAFGAIQQAIAAAGIAAALHEIYEAYMECVTVAGDFEESMSNVEALSGATSEEMTLLSDKAKELGATTKFTAKESADAMGYMAMAGWDAQEMVSGMDGVLQLAAASGEDLAMVSDIVTDNLSAFGLTAADTAHFSDVLAAAATSSNTSVSIMGETFKNCASIAGALGYNVEDVAVAVGLMANSGVKGSVAGTALKNTFNGLLEGVTLTSDAFGEYEYSAVKSDGTTKSFGDTINELRTYFDQMTEAERVNNAITIAGARGYNGLLAILNATDEDYASLTTSINNCTGAASKMAAVKLDNMNGQLTLMNSAWEAVQTTVGEQFTPVMQGAYGVMTDVLTEVNDFLLRHPALVKAVVTFTAVIGAGVAALTAYAAITKVVIPLMQLFTASIPGVNIIMGVVAGVAALTAGIVALVSAANEGVPSVKELTEAAQAMDEAMAEASATYDQTATATLATAQVADTYISKLEELGEGTDASNEHSQTYLNTLALLCNAIPELTEYIDLETGAIEGGIAALREQTDAWKQNAEAQAYQEYMNSLYDEYNAVMTEAAGNSIKLTEAQIKLETAEKNRAAAVERMNELQQEAAESGEYLSGEYYDLQNSLYDYDAEISQAEKTIKNLNKAIEEDNAAVAAAEAEINSAQAAIEELTGATAEQAEAEAEAARQTEELQGTIEGVRERMAALTEAYNEAYGAAYDSISGQYALWDEAADVVATSAGSINSALESQITYWQDYNANLQSLTDRTGDIEGLSDMIASFADGSAESVNAIAGLASASDEDLAEMVANWQELQAEQDAASGSIADLKTDFTATMDEIATELDADIEAMDLGTEAAKSGKATIQGFIDGASGMQAQVEAAYSRIAQAAIDAIDAKLEIHSPSRVMAEKAEMTWQGYIQETEALGPEVQAAMAGTAGAGVDAVGADTLSTAPLSAEVGDYSGGGSYIVTFAPVYNISGAANAAELEAVLQKHDAGLYTLFLEWLEEVGVDTARRTYR